MSHTILCLIIGWAAGDVGTNVARATGSRAFGVLAALVVGAVGIIAAKTDGCQ